MNELDWEIEKRGHKFVRYADDMVILCKSLRNAERTKRLRKASYVFFLDYYDAVRVVQKGTAVYENGSYGGVRGRKIK